MKNAAFPYNSFQVGDLFREKGDPNLKYGYYILYKREDVECGHRFYFFSIMTNKTYKEIIEKAGFKTRMIKVYETRNK